MTARSSLLSYAKRSDGATPTATTEPPATMHAASVSRRALWATGRRVTPALPTAPSPFGRLNGGRRGPIGLARPVEGFPRSMDRFGLTSEHANADAGPRHPR